MKAKDFINKKICVKLEVEDLPEKKSVSSKEKEELKKVFSGEDFKLEW